MWNSKETLLKIEDLKTYAQNNHRLLRIVDGVSFDIRRNEVVALFGECGCGKTTAAESIMGVVRGLPGIIGGEIYLEEENLLEGLDKIVSQRDVKKWKKKYEKRMKEVRGKRLFLVMQGAKSSLNPFCKIINQIKIVSGLNDEQKIDEILEELDVKDKKDRYPHELSGGECQRILLAMAFASKTELLVIDEPTVGIDTLLRDALMQLLKKGFGKNYTSLLLISHDLKLIEKMADRIVVMCSGRIVEVGNTKEIMEKPGHPYTEMLIQTCKIPVDRDESLFVSKSAIPPLDKEYNSCKFYSRCEKNPKDERCSLEEPGLINNVRCYKASERITND